MELRILEGLKPGCRNKTTFKNDEITGLHIDLLSTLYFKRSRNTMENQKIYDLEERTARFAERVRDLCLGLIKNSANSEYILQLIRSSGPVGANYIEANERTGDKDFIMKIKTSRREAKESGYWLRLLIIESEKPQIERSSLQQEAKELVMIFSAILKNRESNKV